MEVTNPLYKGQGIHVIASIFTVDHGVVKVLLIKRKNEPYKDKWALVGGALYNNEDLDAGLRREIKEKSGIEDINLYLVDVHGKVDRSPVMRMVAVSYLGVIDWSKVNILKETIKTSNASWTPLDEVSGLAYDHAEIIDASFEKLRHMILSSNILANLFPDGFMMPEIQKVYEAILGIKFDRRNFRRKLLSLDLIEDTGTTQKFNGRKPAKVYRFKEKIDDINVF